MVIKYDTMELGVLVCRLTENSPKKLIISSTPLVRAIVENQCDWSAIKKVDGIKNIYPGLFCSYEDLPLFINGPDDEDTIIVKWRLELGK